MVVGRGLLLTASGLVIGLAGGLALGSTMRSVLFGIEPFDLPVLVAVQRRASWPLSSRAACRPCLPMGAPR